MNKADASKLVEINVVVLCRVYYELDAAGDLPDEYRVDIEKSIWETDVQNSNIAKVPYEAFRMLVADIDNFGLGGDSYTSSCAAYRSDLRELRNKLETALVNSEHIS